MVEVVIHKVVVEILRLLLPLFAVHITDWHNIIID